MEWWKLVLWVLAIIAIWSIVTKGWDTTKAEPVNSAIDSGGDIISKIASVFNKNNDTQPVENTGKTYLGKPNCLEDIGCNTIQECLNNCTCIEGSCYK